MIKKILVLIIIFSFSFVLFGDENKEPFPVYITQKSKVKIDGNKNDWPVTIPFIIESDNQVRREKRETPEDFGVTIYSFFDAKNFYIFAEYTDKTPMKNRHKDNEMYQGDAMEIYLGFREEETAVYGDNDFQFGLGYRTDGPATWLWNKGRVMVDVEVTAVKTDKGFNVEAKFPLKNFTNDPKKDKRKIKNGDTIWIDFAINDGKGKGKRETQMVWNGDGEGWQTTKVWRKAKVYKDQNIFNKPYILIPPDCATNTYMRFYFYDKGKPYAGKVKIGTQEYNTDEKGGVTVNTKNAGNLNVSFKSGGIEVAESVNIVKKKEKLYVILPVKEIKVNQIGYIDKDEKVFILTDNDEKLKTKDFEIISPDGDKVFFKGKITGPEVDKITGDKNYYGDFSKFKKHGEYLIKVEGIGESYLFNIGSDPFQMAFAITMRSYYLQRCGISVKDTDISGVSYDVCHADDGYMIEPFLKDGTKNKKDTTGGWHDAGDYGKYIPTAGITCVQLLMLYELSPGKFNKFRLEIPESNNSFPDILDEVKWELDWMLKMQDKSGGVYHKLNTYNFPPKISPDQDKEPRLINTISTSSTGIFAGTMAYAYRIFKKADPEYAEKLKEAALKAGKFLLENNTKNVFYAVEDNTGLYKTGGVSDELFWGFSEIFRLTGDKQYYDAAMLYKGMRFEYPIIGWENTHTLGIFALYYAENTPDSVRKEIKKLIKTESDKITEKIMNNGYRSGLSWGEYTWASNKNLCAKGMQLIMAYEIFKKEQYKKAARYQLDYIYGVNVLSKSFVTDLGADSVRYPHHRYIDATEIMIPGLMVGGPNNNAECGTYDKNLGPRGYRDYDPAFSCNEYAIDYNAPLVFLTGYFMKEQQGGMYQSTTLNSNKGLSVVLLIIIAIAISLLIAAGTVLIIKKKRYKKINTEKIIFE